MGERGTEQREEEEFDINTTGGLADRRGGDEGFGNTNVSLPSRLPKGFKCVRYIVVGLL